MKFPLSKSIIILACLLPLAAGAYTDQEGNSDETLAIFKPAKDFSPADTQEQSINSYVDTAVYIPKSTTVVYVGILGSINNVNMGRDLSYQSWDKLITQSSSRSFYGVGYGGLLGWGVNFHQALYLGVELFGDIDSLSNTGSVCANCNSYKSTIQYNFGANLAPGIYFGKHGLVQVHIGPALSHVKLEIYDNMDNQHVSHIVYGVLFGVSAEYFLPGNLFSLRGEYDYIPYVNFNDDYNDRYDIKYHNKYSISMHRAVLALVFHANFS